jgi:hypothetical protein
MCLGALYYAAPEQVFFAATREQESEHYEDGNRYMSLSSLYDEYAKSPAQRSLPATQGETDDPTTRRPDDPVPSLDRGPPRVALSRARPGAASRAPGHGAHRRAAGLAQHTLAAEADLLQGPLLGGVVHVRAGLEPVDVRHREQAPREGAEVWRGESGSNADCHAASNCATQTRWAAGAGSTPNGSRNSGSGRSAFT